MSEKDSVVNERLKYKDMDEGVGWGMSKTKVGRPKGQ